MLLIRARVKTFRCLPFLKVALSRDDESFVYWQLSFLQQQTPAKSFYIINRTFLEQNVEQNFVLFCGYIDNLIFIFGFTSIRQIEIVIPLRSNLQESIIERTFYNQLTIYFHERHFTETYGKSRSKNKLNNEFEICYHALIFLYCNLSFVVL